MAEDEIKPEVPEDKTQLFGEGERRLKPPYLVIVDGPHKGARFPLQEGDNFIGRLEECHVVLDDQSVSRKHSKLHLGDQGWMVEDLGSKNGTAVNGAFIREPVVLGHKDLLRFGIYTLRLVTQEIDPKEEMAIPEEVGELGTVLVAEGGEGEETAQLGLAPKKPEAGAEEDEAGKLITAPHSPLEAEGHKKISKPRLWVLGGVAFAVLLAASLYFYWQFVLAPGKEVAKIEPVQPRQELHAIPLGPPEPEKPKTIPVFLDCVANPFPAEVYFEAKRLGKTPFKANVDLIPEKEYEIEARFNMPEIQEQYTDRVSFSARADQSMIPILFRAPVGTVKISEMPRDASIYLEAYFEYNQFQARPVKLQNIVLNKPIYAPFGRYILELRRFKPVGDPSNLIEDIVYRREFYLKEDQPAMMIDVTETGLDQFPAHVRSEPPGADVFVDGRKVGTTPFRGELPVGKHTLTLRKEGYFEETQTIEADINTPFRTEITLRTSAAGEKLNLARSFLRQGAYESSLQSLSEVFNLGPSEGEAAEARYLLGNAYLGMGAAEKAYGYYQHARQHEKYKYWSQLGLAKVFALQGKTAQALIPLVDVLLNAQEEVIVKEANNFLREISPLRSVVYIQSDPPGAEVYLNDKKLAQATPVLLHEMGLGSYKIRLTKPGFQPLDLNINLSVNEFNPVLAKLKPLPD